MQKIIGVTDLQRRFRAVLDEVVSRHMPFVLTRGSRPEAVLVPYEDFLRFQELEEREVLRAWDRTRARLARLNADFGDDEVESDIARARAELD